MKKKGFMQKRFSHYWEILFRKLWWVFGALVITGLPFLQSIRDELPPEWQEGFRIINFLSFLPDWNPIVYITIFFFLCVLIILESSHQKISKVEDAFEKYKNEPPQMAELGKLHTNGVVLRNKGLKISKKNIKDLPAWQKEYEEWKRKVVNVVSEVSASQAQLIETLNRTPEKGIYKFEKAVNDIHRRDLRTLEKRLEIVEKIIYKYSGLEKPAA